MKNQRNQELHKTDNHHEPEKGYLGMAAHDLRNPLSIVMYYAHFLLEDNADPLTDTQRQFLGEILHQAEFMQDLVDNILDLNALAAGKVIIHRHRCDLEELLSENLLRNQLLFKDKGIRLRLQYEDDMPILWADAHKIEQVLNNLISNAAKYSPPDRDVVIKARQNGDMVIISVKDQGPGITPAEQKQLFQPFARTRNRTTAGEPSTGLGLTISRHLVQGHGGRLWVESLPGQGATFSFELPFGEPDPDLDLEPG